MGQFLFLCKLQVCLPAYFPIKGTSCFASFHYFWILLLNSYYWWVFLRFLSAKRIVNAAKCNLLLDAESMKVENGGLEGLFLVMPLNWPPLPCYENSSLRYWFFGLIHMAHCLLYSPRQGELMAWKPSQFLLTSVKIACTWLGISQTLSCSKDPCRCVHYLEEYLGAHYVWRTVIRFVEVFLTTFCFLRSLAPLVLLESFPGTKSSAQFFIDQNPRWKQETVVSWHLYYLSLKL